MPRSKKLKIKWWDNHISNKTLSELTNLKEKYCKCLNINTKYGAVNIYVNLTTLITKSADYCT